MENTSQIHTHTCMHINVYAQNDHYLQIFNWLERNLYAFCVLLLLLFFFQFDLTWLLYRALGKNIIDYAYIRCGLSRTCMFWPWMCVFLWFCMFFSVDFFPFSTFQLKLINQNQWNHKKFIWQLFFWIVCVYAVIFCFRDMLAVYPYNLAWILRHSRILLEFMIAIIVIVIVIALVAVVVVSKHLCTIFNDHVHTINKLSSVEKYLRFFFWNSFLCVDQWSFAKFLVLFQWELG